MNTSVDLRRVALRRHAATKRRRQRLLSANENGAIVEYEPVTSCTAAAPSRRIPLPPRHALTRPRLLEYYKIVTGREPSLMRCDTREEDYNYSWFIPAGIEGRKRKEKGGRRLQEALVASRISLGAFEEGVRGVFDSGHLYSPICRWSRPNHEDKLITDGSNKMTNRVLENEENADSNIIFVRPRKGELPTEAKVTSDELVRVAPKGREWDRQHALRHGIGPTAQEAIIDRRIDSRYRLPGDYVRRNGRGELVDARGRPMHAAGAIARKNSEAALFSGI
ncbi:hypothetical protein TcBrA4_0055130 [Trypanosoma cruzi]|nr:hypothetical protein TcBrA4_0055130 [Trypanosoma cruzi]